MFSFPFNIVLKMRTAAYYLYNNEIIIQEETEDSKRTLNVEMSNCVFGQLRFFCLLKIHEDKKKYMK